MSPVLVAIALAGPALLAAVTPGGRAYPTSAVAVLPSGSEFTLEVASDEASREKGYMGRASVGRSEGMLFVFDADVREGFWMKNCKVALDIVWLDRSFRVVTIAADRKPCPPEGECPSILPDAPVRYVIEFAAGTTAREHLAPGDRVVVLSEPPLR